jgi:hypothetical protein
MSHFLNTEQRGEKSYMLGGTHTHSPLQLVLKYSFSSSSTSVDPASDSLFTLTRIPTFVVEFYLFVLALFQLGWNIHYMRKRSLLFARPRQYVEVILRDSIWYYTA